MGIQTTLESADFDEVAWNGIYRQAAMYEASGSVERAIESGRVDRFGNPVDKDKLYIDVRNARYMEKTGGRKYAPTEFHQ